jgi:peroxiredoxin
MQGDIHPLAMPLAAGSKAPDFTLKTKTSAGLEDVRLSDSFGKQQTVLLFFPFAFTSVCTKEMCDTTSGLGDYEKLGARVIAISVDSPHAQHAWAAANNITVTIASDLNKTVIRDYEVVLPMLGGVGDAAARAAFVIGKEGTIKYSEQTPTPKDLPNFAAIKAALAS